MDTYDDLLLRPFRSAEYFKGSFPENSVVFETKRKHYMSISKSHMAIKLVRIGACGDLQLPTQSCNLLIFWPCDNQSAENFKRIFLKKYKYV